MLLYASALEDGSDQRFLEARRRYAQQIETSAVAYAVTSRFERKRPRTSKPAEYRGIGRVSTRGSFGGAPLVQSTPSPLGHETRVRSLVCLGCRETGHYKDVCRTELECYTCRAKGHRVMYCPQRRGAPAPQARQIQGVPGVSQLTYPGL